VGAVVVGGFLALFACSNQAEGERCESLQGNDDCQDGLICYQAALLIGTTSDRCCPQDRSQATTQVCRAATNGIGDAGFVDTGPPSAADAGDAGSASTSDADATADAADAAADG
jgi:hypothetical protein